MTDLASAVWRRSSYSNASGSCVEVATNLPGVVAVRDSKRPAAPPLLVDPADFRAFVAAARAGRFHRA